MKRYGVMLKGKYNEKYEECIYVLSQPIRQPLKKIKNRTTPFLDLLSNHSFFEWVNGAREKGLRDG
jgi:hypothetical protein